MRIKKFFANINSLNILIFFKKSKNKKINTSLKKYYNPIFRWFFSVKQ